MEGRLKRPSMSGAPLAQRLDKGMRGSMRLRHFIFVAVLVVAAACGGEGDAIAPAPSVVVGPSAFGEILIDAEGFTLYSFGVDQNGVSACYEHCAHTWPPLLVEGNPEAGEGVDPALLGTTIRDDGTRQLTYNGLPLYRYSPDIAPGDTNGQGIGDVWFVVAPDGDPVFG